MGRVRLGIGTEFIWNKAVYRILSCGNDTYTAKALQFNIIEHFTLTQILDYLNSGTLIFRHLNDDEDDEENEDAKRKSKIKNVLDLDLVDQEDIDVANFRLECIEPLLKAKNRVDLKRAVERQLIKLEAAGSKTSRTRLYAWRKLYLERGNDIRALLSDRGNQGGKGKSRMDKEAFDILKGYLSNEFLEPKNITGATIYNFLTAQITALNASRKRKIKMPSKSTVYREIKKIDVYTLTKSKYGPVYTYSRYGYVSSTREKPTRPLQFVQCDHTTIDVFLVEDVSRKLIKSRAYVTVLLDVFTRYPLGINIWNKPPSYESVMLALKNAISVKKIKEKYKDVKHEWLSYGLPETLIVDNGKDFKSQHLKNACARLGIELDFNLPKQPWQKPEIERFFRTMNSQLNHQLDGTTFSDPMTKKDKEYDSEKEAGIGFMAYLEMFHEWMLNYYCESFHEGLENYPSKMWEEHTAIHTPHFPDNMIDCHIALCPIANRKVGKKGIRWEHHWYQSTELWQLWMDNLTRGNKDGVDFKYDPSDISKIYVIDDFNKKYLEVPCTDLVNTQGLHLSIHKEIRKEVNELRSSGDKAELGTAMVNYLNKGKKEKEKNKAISRKAAKHFVKGSNQTKSGLDALSKIVENKEKVREIKKTNRKQRYETEMYVGGAFYDD